MVGLWVTEWMDIIKPNVLAVSCCLNAGNPCVCDRGRLELCQVGHWIVGRADRVTNGHLLQGKKRAKKKKNYNYKEQAKKKKLSPRTKERKREEKEEKTRTKRKENTWFKKKKLATKFALTLARWKATFFVLHLWYVL